MEGNANAVIAYAVANTAEKIQRDLRKSMKRLTVKVLQELDLGDPLAIEDEWTLGDFYSAVAEIRGWDREALIERLVMACKPDELREAWEATQNPEAVTAS